jgi:hypothetical protein
MNRGETAALGECRRNLPRRRVRGVEQDRLDPGPQMSDSVARSETAGSTNRISRGSVMASS